ncbi:NUDIX hydrolase [Streptomyces sp. NRRL B-24484]|uniref:NUDIX hydrolase n=1 Tax=Streptomyces sp. NRRL B-24484 TaxID=1463833 RepID=UPI0009983800|nr:NUDIX domain-containing protein [Streptomyces sp. NRRL B-24484]
MPKLQRLLGPVLDRLLGRPPGRPVPRPDGAPSGRRPRAAARTVVLAPDGAVFLLRSDNAEVGVHWTAPGGGLEEGETPTAGALRELHEETGWTDIEPDRLLCTWEHDFTWHGIPVRQHEHIFLASGPRRGPVGDVSGAHRADGILEWRWWSPEELASPDADALWPPQLPALMAAVSAGAGAAATGADGTLMDGTLMDGVGTGGAVGPVHLGHVPQGTPNSRPDEPLATPFS